MVRNNNFLENVKLAFKGIGSHKLRSFLTMLGIIIGIASIIAIVSTIKGTNEQIKNNLIGSGTNTVTVSPYQGDYQYEFEYQSIPDYFTTVKDETMEEILKIDNVESASRVLTRSYFSNISYGKKSLEGASLYGVDQDGFITLGYKIMLGRGFSEVDDKNNLKSVILDTTASKKLFGDEYPIGKTINFTNEVFTVVGIVEQMSSYQPVIETYSDYYTYMNISGGKVFIPRKAWPIINIFDEPEKVLVKAKNTDAMTEVGRLTSQILNNALGISEADSNDQSKVVYKADDLLEQAKQIQELSSSTNSMLIWIAGISLLVGGIGVMNIMLVSVTERTREIGLKKALGAKRRRILSQFLTEAAVLTSIGGILGVIVGIGLAYIVNFITGVPVAISGSAILVSVIFSAVVGIVFGLLPSIKASRLDPIEALRYE